MMAKKAMAMDKGKKKAALALLLVIATVLLAVFVPQLAQANTAEADVSTAAEFRAAMDNATVTRINLTNDITLDKGAITMNRNKSSLVVNGNGFTITQFSSNASTDLIRLNNSGNLRDITFRNMNIVGRNNSGFVFIFDGTAYRNVTVTFDGVTYNGPMLAMARDSNVVIRNSDVVLARGHTTSTCAVIKANNITFEGNVNLENLTTNAAELLWLKRNGSSFVVAAGANVNVANQGNRLSGFAKFKALNGSMTFEDGSSFSYIGSGSFQAGTALNAVYIGNTTRVHIETVGDFKDGSLIEIKNGVMEVEENAVVDIIARNNSHKKPVLKFVSRCTLTVNNPESFFIYNSATKSCGYGLAIGTSCCGNLQVRFNGIESLEYWRMNTSPHTSLPLATFEWVSSESSGFSAFFTFTGKKVTNVGTENYFGATPFNATTATLSNVNVIRIKGGSLHEVLFVTSGGSPADFTGNVRNNRTIEEPRPPTKDGNVFAGWYVNRDLSGSPWDFNRNVVTGNTILYAKWESSGMRTITYNAGGIGQDFGLGLTSTVSAGSQYTIKSNEAVDIFPIFDNLVIESWNTIFDGSGARYEVGEVIIAEENLILYAQWTER